MNINKYLMQQRHEAYSKNLHNILKLLEEDRKARVLDLGCDDGKWTKKIRKRIGTQKILGIDINQKKLNLAAKRKIKIKEMDLNKKLEFSDGHFDVIHANQVIEHVYDLDLFTSEIYRILKKGGYAVISTENLASWHNIGALILGYMPFSITNIVSKVSDIGNPLAPHYKEKAINGASWKHHVILTIRGLKDLFELYGFRVEKIIGAGYYPFGNLFDNIDKNHSAFITFKIRK